MAVVDLEIEQSMASMQVVIELGRVIRDRKVLPVKVCVVCLDDVRDCYWNRHGII